MEDKQMQHISQTNSGNSDTLIIKQSQIPKISNENQRLLKIQGFGINRAEILQREGKYPVPQGHSQILGLEAGGTIVGDESGQIYSALLNGGGYSEYALVHKDHLIPFPSNQDSKNAAGFAECWLTAYQILVYIAQLKDNESVMIYAGASGVGTSVIQIAKNFRKNVKIFATVSNQEKIDFCQNLGATKVYNYKEQKFSEIIDDIKQQNNGKGVDIVLDCVGASNYELTAGILGLDSRWVLFSGMGGLTIENFNMAVIFRNRAQFTGTTLRTRSDEYKADLIKHFNQDILPLFKENKLKFLVDKNYDLNWQSPEPVQKAHLYMESNKSIGKIQIQIKQK